ncbi:MAG: hypothetical protein WAV05_19100 [Anaerolineales bacterium]
MRPLKTLKLLFVLMILLSLTLAGCKKDPRVTFIQGLWYYKDAHLANIPGESAQVTNWEFDNGYFSIYTCCFYKANYSGYYSVVERTENKLTLEMYDLKGQTGDLIFHQDDIINTVLKIDAETDTLLINGDGPYTRVAP